MKVSHRGLYALKALVHLAEAHERGLVKIHEIAQEESIPEKFLEGILVTLKNARLVASQRGRDGGYRLRRAPAEILVGEVVRIMDGPLAPFGDAVELAHGLDPKGDAGERAQRLGYRVVLDPDSARGSGCRGGVLAVVRPRDQRLRGQRVVEADPPLGGRVVEIAAIVVDDRVVLQGQERVGASPRDVDAAAVLVGQPE